MSMMAVAMAALALVPAPQKMEFHDGSLALPKGKAAGELAVCRVDGTLPKEGYRLRISADGIAIAAADADGEFYARQTLNQIAEQSQDGRLPCLDIEDGPEYEWRGLLFDDCRHFFGKQTVKRVLDLMARYKLNRFDWHLTENEAFRLEVPGYPELVKYAAVRSKSIARDHTTYLPPYKYDDMKYGPFFYTEAELKELVAYAEARHVTMLPGIDFPAHCSALLAAYPEFCCHPELCADREPELSWIGNDRKSFCLGNPRALKFVDDLIDYVCRVFPGKYVNVNADECPFEPWLACPKCAALMKEKGFKEPGELYGWFVKRMIERVEGHGKVALAADEVLGVEGVGKTFIPLSWRMKDGDAGGHKFVSYVEAAARGYDVVMQPHMWTYFCYGQGLENDPCSYGNPSRMAGGGNLTLHRCYLFNPRQDVPAENQRHILGGNFCNWSEMTLTEPELMWKMWPRGCAMAEVFWTGSKRPGFADFKRRMKRERMHLIRHGFNCALLEDPPEPFDTAGGARATPESQGIYSKDILEWLGDVRRQFGNLNGYAIRRHGKLIAQGGETNRWTKVYDLKDLKSQVCVAFDVGKVHGSVARLDELVAEWIVPTLHPSPRAEDPVSNARLDKEGLDLGWSVSFRLDTSSLERDETLFDYPDVVTARIRFAGRDVSLRDADDEHGNYLNFPLADGRVPVLELKGPSNATVGVPLAVLSNPLGWHEVKVRAGNDARFCLLVDGTAYDEDGVSLPCVCAKAETKPIDVSPRVSELSFSVPAGPVLREETYAHPISRPMQFWTPDGHNAWVGDVAVCTFKGRFHLFYLIDRRHHSSKNKTGGHYFAHISSPDLIHWDDHGTAVPADAWWQTLGTGTPFEWQGRLYLSYGLHTPRLMKREDTCEAGMRRYFAEHGEMGTFGFGELKGYPIGGTYAVSDDGVHFSRSGMLFHTAQNPTVYVREDGRLGCVNSYGGNHGLYVSDRIGGWRLFDKDMPISGDCPCLFAWNGRHYLLQGFVGMAYNEDGRLGGWVDWSKTGDDVYNGFSVPMVCRWGANRRIMAGWISHPCGWGGWLAFHELVQHADGTLGVKWLKEITRSGDTHVYSGKGGEDVVIRVPRADGGPDLELSVEAVAGRAQFSDVTGEACAPRQLTQAEYNRMSESERKDRAALRTCEAKRFAVQNVRGLDKPYDVRLAVCYDAKSGCTLFDAEVAGDRAFVCYRVGKYLKPFSKGCNHD